MGSLEERCERGISYKTDGKYDEAIAEFKAILEEDPNYAEAHRQIGNCKHLLRSIQQT